MRDIFNSIVGIINDRTPIGQTQGGGYVPLYVFLEFKQYERDGLMSYINQLRYKKFVKYKNAWLKTRKVVNFNLIHNYWKDKLDELYKKVKKHQAVTCANLEPYTQKMKNSIVSCARRCGRSDMFLEMKIIFMKLKFAIKF